MLLSDDFESYCWLLTAGSGSGGLRACELGGLSISTILSHNDILFEKTVVVGTFILHLQINFGV